MESIAQLVEHWIVIPSVAGSIPVTLPNYLKPSLIKLKTVFFVKASSPHGACGMRDKLPFL